MKILYEDNHLLVVEKPVNMPVQGDASGDMDLLTACKAYIKEKYHKPGEVYLGLVHRLDRPVGGVMVFARTSKAASRLSDQFKGRKAKKHYVAIVQGEAPAYGTLTDWLYKNEKTNTVSVVPPNTSGAKEAKLHYRTLNREKGLSLLEVELMTGRPHQIRVQLSHMGCPILGDQRYNPSARPGSQIRLWAYSLTLQHPTLGENMTFFSLPPWQEFAPTVAYLPAASAATVLYEDEDILLADKNPGVEVETDLLSQLEAITSPLYPVHRLDSQTRGLVVLAKNEKSRGELEEAFYRHETNKVYEAVLFGIPEKKSDHLTHFALKEEGDRPMRLVRENTPGALRMELAYEVVAQKPPLSKVRIRLFTGRTHQIRLQMAAIGCPVLGDDKYGSFEGNKRYKQRTQLLLAKELTVLGKTFVSPRELPWEEL